MPVPYSARMIEKTDRLAVDIPEAARMLSVSPRTIQNYIAVKLLPALKIGRRTVIPVRALEAFLRTDHESPTKRAPREVVEA
jgi:excisionase family DNA binding protein